MWNQFGGFKFVTKLSDFSIFTCWFFIAATGSSKSSTTSISFSETSVSEPASNSNSQNLGSMFKPPTGTWSCSVCLIQNKPDVTQCAACQSPKPETKTEPASQSSSQDLSSMFKPPTGTWSCLVCMVQNKPDTTQCAACQTPKPEKKTGRWWSVG